VIQVTLLIKSEIFLVAKPTPNHVFKYSCLQGMRPWASTWPTILARPKQAPHNLLLLLRLAWPMVCDVLGLARWEDKAQLNGGTLNDK
jgi:hypothetical protein